MIYSNSNNYISSIQYAFVLSGYIHPLDYAIFIIFYSLRREGNLLCYMYLQGMKYSKLSLVRCENTGIRDKMHVNKTGFFC